MIVNSAYKVLLPKGTSVICTAEHPDGDFTRGKRYRINAHRTSGVGYAGVRIRDNRRQRKDFNFIPDSRNYLWKYFCINNTEEGIS